MFVQEAELELAAVGDSRAPGGVVTIFLCGHWEHEGQCRWPHHTAVDKRSGSRITVRTIFACDPNDEQLIRQRISAGLRSGRLQGPSGLTTWTVLREAADAVRADEQLLAQRLADFS